MQLKLILGSPLEPLADDIVPCGNACPVCNGKTNEFVMPVSRAGTSRFVADTFINNPPGRLTPVLFVQALAVYPDVGRVVNC